MKYSKSLLVVLVTLALIPGISSLRQETAAAQINLTWPEIDLVEITAGLVHPLHLTHAGDNSGRLFLVEQGGAIKIIANGQLLDRTFLDISARVRSPASGGGSEEGLLSVAFPPGYGTEKDYFYVYYTRLDGDNQLSRFYLTADADVADPSSEEPIMTFAHPNYQNHNGGLLTFGPDGYLYIGTGDGGGGGDPAENAQDTSSLLGKLLRIDVEFFNPPPIDGEHKVYLPAVVNHSAVSYERLTYRIPEDNPFFGEPGHREEIWALGLRNPWRFSFDRLTNDLYVADVGQNRYEEVNFQPASNPGGENYGWNIMEAMHCFEPPVDCDRTGLTEPVMEYSHDFGTSITGGFVYRGHHHPNLAGIYFYADFGSGRIWGLQHQMTDQGRLWASQELLNTPHLISSFGEAQSGELFLINYVAGEVYQIISP